MVIDPTNGTKGVRVKTSVLLEKLKKNRAAHRDIFEKALVGYRASAIAELERSLSDARANKRIRHDIELVEPMDMSREYDRVIEMLTMSVDDVVTLDSRDFQSYVMDDWAWTQQFTTSNSAYLGDR
jgi:hypothetical protein